MSDAIAWARDYADDEAGDMGDVVMVALADDLADARALLEAPSGQRTNCQDGRSAKPRPVKCAFSGLGFVESPCWECRKAAFLTRTK